MKVIGYENNNRVVVKQRYKADPNDFELFKPLKPVLDELLISRPLWEFEVEQPYTTNKATAIAIKQDGEELGWVAWKYVGSEHKYFVTNDRIANSMERRNGYSTSNDKKALNKIKKMFSRASLSEKMEKVQETLKSQMNSAGQRKHYELRELRSTVDKHALAYIQTVVWPTFVEYMEKHEPTVYNTILKRDEVQDEMSHITAIHKEFSEGNALLVLREGSMYSVKSKEGFKIYNDNDLPEHVKLKLGMLKLVEDKTFITNMGFRSSESAFVVTQEKEDGQV